MSEKYEINLIDCTYMIVDIKSRICYCECLHKHVAELVCRLLNEHEARKSEPKIDKIHKSEIIIFLINCAEIQNSIKYLHSAKIIDALEASE